MTIPMKQSTMVDEISGKPSHGSGDAAGEESQRILLPTPGVKPNPIVDRLKEHHLNKGVLIPLKTTQEVRQDHTTVHAYITRAPTKSANDVISALRALRPEGGANPLPHLRTCAKPTDLPAHLKTKFMNDDPAGRQIHTAKSTWIYIIAGEVEEIGKEDLMKTLLTVEALENEPFISTITIPLLAPTSQVQAALWSSQYWPTVYRKNNPLGPHPSMVGRGTDEIKEDASLWMALAHRVALQAKEAGIGEAIGAVIVQRGENGAELVGLAGDARKHQECNGVFLNNTLTHCVLRAISMVAQKLVRHEHREAGVTAGAANLYYDCFQDQPLIELERQCFKQEHPNKDGYLCHGLELSQPCATPANGAKRAYQALQILTGRYNFRSSQPAGSVHFLSEAARIRVYVPTRSFSRTSTRSIFGFLNRLIKTTSPDDEMNKRAASGVNATSSPPKKRKTDNVQKYYAVQAGFCPGVYMTYAECSAQTAGFKGAVFKSFTSRSDAEAFAAGEKVAASSDDPERFYAVAVGNPTGIYTDWNEAALAIKGVKGPKYKRFGSRMEAVVYIKQFGSREAIEALGETYAAMPVTAPTSSASVTSSAKKTASKTAAVKAELGVQRPAEDVLQIYTDGSSLANGKAGSRAGVGVYFGDGDARNLSERLVGEPQTNQRAELMAMLRALETAPLKQTVQIISDSQYSINCVTQWAIGWKQKGWKTATGENVKNQDIIRAVLDKMDERTKAGANTYFHWVKGHASNRGNVAADRLAVRGAKMT
ncbi:RNase H domain protein [Metarhizium rileyi]|uniref:ribonuclease H n=1 Tax=Metarhizium rileyi (strain RCEF 4871) TaxID=1649241 RepID=A0A162J9W3_METRR|nr:RNase H domain protein [Metarhizium rileyi RCEF 4871]TWU74138.1 tRNA-specific adenosine deaminase subunit tad3 [Metarhizium rileyi]